LLQKRHAAAENLANAAKTLAPRSGIADNARISEFVRLPSDDKHNGDQVREPE